MNDQNNPLAALILFQGLQMGSLPKLHFPTFNLMALVQRFAAFRGPQAPVRSKPQTERLADLLDHRRIPARKAA